MCNEETICKLISLAESVRGEVLFDLQFDIDATDFFRLKFQNDECKKMKLCSLLYKYS
jgi:Holliday junction resolvase